MTDTIKKLCFCLIIMVIGFIVYLFDVQPNSASVTYSNKTPYSSKINQPTSPIVTVHIAGAVQFPGVYDIQLGTRTIDALTFAGGTTPQANLDKINLAKPIKDGQRLYVPFESTKSQSKKSVESLTKKISINLASHSTLQQIPGIGPALANEIITYRNSIGKFTSFKQLLNVKYIGTKMLSKIKPYLTL